MKTSQHVRRATAVAFFAVASLIVPSAHATNLLVNTATEQSSGFTNGSPSPFQFCTYIAANTPVVTTLNGQPCVKFTWHQSAYDGTRLARGTEGCGPQQYQKEGWYGFYIYLPDPGYPKDKTAGIGQLFASNSACNSWAAMFNMVNTDLRVSHRGNCGTPTDALVYSNFPRNRWVSIVAHFVVSHLNAGKFEVFIDGVSKYNATGINFGYDTWTSSDALQAPHALNPKWGQYDYDAGNFTPGEVRTSYYTNVNEIAGNPSGALSYILNPVPGAIGPIIYPAESAVVAGGTVIEATNVGFNGTGYANFPTTGGTLTFNNVNGGAGGTKTVIIRYALALPARTGQLVVNGVATNITLDNTGGPWTTWADKTVTVNLNGGTGNTIQLKSTGQDYGNIDEITVQ